ncbi:MAG: hypothetical protein ACYC1E_10295 [Propionibacteriaceae bacterium]
MPGSDEQWSRISAEAQLRPEHGVVADVPTPQVTPLTEDDATEDPIELAEVPPPSGDADVEPAPRSVQPIQVVPFHRGPAQEAGPDVIVAAPFDVRASKPDLVEARPPEMITDVPAPHEDPVEVVAQLPDMDDRLQKTSWWRLMLGGGKPRAERSAPAPEAVVYPNLPET